MLSDKAKSALAKAYASKGPHRGQLKAKCPPSHTLESAAWNGAMMVCNPYLVSIGACLLNTPEQQEIFNEVRNHFDSLPREYQVMAQRDRETLTNLGVW